MITVVNSEYRVSETHGKYRLFHFCGLAGEEPEGTYGGAAVANGSVYYEIDTGESLVYDEEGGSWESAAGLGAQALRAALDAGSVAEAAALHSLPAGAMCRFLGGDAPDGWLPLDGRVLAVSEYPELAAYIEDALGASNYYGGDGVETFALPVADAQGNLSAAGGGTGEEGQEVQE